jgi:CubicO group peptidase (beta-lactamase class C family)
LCPASDVYRAGDKLRRYEGLHLMTHIISPRDVNIDEEKLETAWRSLEDAAERHEFGGAVALIQRHGQTILHRATGWAVREPEVERTAMAPDTIFDLASITKVVATLPSVLRLIDEGRVELDQPVGAYLPAFGTEGDKAGVTIRRLLSHTSGVLSWRAVFTEAVGPEGYIANLAADQPYKTPGAQVEYTCLGFILLGEVVRQVSGMSVAEYAARHVLKPLGMTESLFTPPAELRPRIAATEYGNTYESDQDLGTPVTGPWRTGLIRGEVHDGNAWYGFDGLSANAGLFGTASDLVRYGQMWLNGGELDGVRILSEGIVREATTEQTGLDAPNDRRGLGWVMAAHPGADTRTHSSRGLSQRAFGHTGFTGTSLWMDPERDLIVVLLTNRVHPSVNAAYLPTRATFTQTIAEACS